MSEEAEKVGLDTVSSFKNNGYCYEQ
jgi:hypothetical protein